MFSKVACVRLEEQGQVRPVTGLEDTSEVLITSVQQGQVRPAGLCGWMEDLRGVILPSHTWLDNVIVNNLNNLLRVESSPYCYTYPSPIRSNTTKIE